MRGLPGGHLSNSIPAVLFLKFLYILCKQRTSALVKDFPKAINDPFLFNF